MSRVEPPERGPVDLPAPVVDPEPDKKWRKPRQQIGALPFRFDDQGQLRVMLITSRETRRWVIPKGWPMRGLKPHRAAEREAYEEAGLKGKIGKVAVGVYAYEKRLANGLAVPCEVSVFPFQVTSQRKRWPERGQRDGRWFRPDEAADVVQEEGLQHLLRGFKPPAGAEKARGKRVRRSKPAKRSQSKRERKPASTQ
jgi:8-oxo-dGTP pyrophosphatase MutT (NUDIX family)